MSAISALLFVAAVLALLHSAYSGYEFSQFRKRQPLGSGLADLDVPLDIKIEAALGVALACIGAVVESIGALRPIEYPKAMAQLEAEGVRPFQNLEVRPVFQDILAKRKEYAAWDAAQTASK